MIKNDYLFQNHLVKQLPKIARRFYAGRPMLVFCSSRKLTIDASNMLLKECGPTFFLPPNNQDAVDQIRSAAASVTSQPLSQLLSCGIGYHSAGLEPSERMLVEREFSCRYTSMSFDLSMCFTYIEMTTHAIRFDHSLISAQANRRCLHNDISCPGCKSPC